MIAPIQHRLQLRRHPRSGITVVEVLIVIAVIGLLLSLLWPWVVSARESARRNSCQGNLRQLGMALGSYHETFGHLPPAGVWTTRELDSLALNHSRRVDLFTQSNWTLAVLPFTTNSDLAKSLDSERPIGDPRNESIRNSRLALMNCPSDTFNTPANPFRLTPEGEKVVTFSRGNYAINGGSQCPKDGDGNTSFRTGDPAHLVMDRATREFRYWGNGVAGFNVSFSLKDFENGAGSLVALEEIRAGVHSVDSRGLWALGQIGGSVTWAHGVNGDCYGPNNQHPKSDDLLDGDLINKTVGTETLSKLGMPCVHYVNFNSQATARSMHADGVNLSMVDGTIRFVSNSIDPGLWHVMHSRETPRSLLSGDLDSLIRESMFPREKAPPQHENTTNRESESNSIGMKFVLIPAGEFEMGVPDQQNAHELPPECPQHTVRLSHPYYLGIHEVTQSQYLKVMENPPTNKPDLDPFSPIPVVGVTWHEADEFCHKLSLLPEEQAARRRYRLPTESEWEFACRSGSRSPYQWISQRQSNDDSGEAAGISPPLSLSPVGTYRPNAFGLFDMRGNAWEWCADWFDRNYYSRSPATNPQGPESGHFKVIRGSDWTFIGEGCKLSYATMPAWKSNPFVGFRVVCQIAE